jgi:fucokinase
MPPFDHLLITACNEDQAESLRQRVLLRLERGLLPSSTRISVSADPHARRIGSGGATLLALRRLLPPRTRVAGRDLLVGERALLLHAGGDCKRLPSFAACGKLFLPLPGSTASGTAADLFDLLLERLLRCPLPATGGLVVACGDVLLDLPPEPAPDQEADVTGFAFPGPPAVAARHGVFVIDSAGRVLDFLQKPAAAQLAAHHAFLTEGSTLIDTGLLCLRPGAIDRLLTVSGRLKTGHGWAHQNRPGYKGIVQVTVDILSASDRPDNRQSRHFRRAVRRCGHLLAANREAG